MLIRADRTGPMGELRRGARRPEGIAGTARRSRLALEPGLRAPCLS